jgi:hypothetical protein
MPEGPATQAAQAAQAQNLILGLTAAATTVAPLLPVVFGLVGAFARAALSDDEKTAIRKCLELAIADDAARKVPSRWHPFKRRRSKRERMQEARQAAEDVLVYGVPMFQEMQVPLVPNGAGGTIGAPAQAHVEDGAAEQAAFIKQAAALAQQQVREVLAPTRFIPWTTRVSAALTFAFTASWDELQRKGSDDQRERAANMIVGEDGDVVGKVNAWTLNAFGERVGRGFEARMARHEKLQFLVRRLDKHDELLGQHALIEAAQGIRVAAVFAVAIGVAGVLAVAEIAVHAFF